MTICLIDDREQERGERAFDYFLENDFQPEITELIFGDFVFLDNDLSVAFEYKTLEDYFASINDNRVFNQALNQSSNSFSDITQTSFFIFLLIQVSLFGLIFLTIRPVEVREYCICRKRQ